MDRRLYRACNAGSPSLWNGGAYRGFLLPGHLHNPGCHPPADPKIPYASTECKVTKADQYAREAFLRHER